MSKKGQESLTRSNKRRKQTKSKMDRLLNILIAVVSILIILNLVIVLNDDPEKEANSEVAQEENNDSSDNMKENEDTNKTDNNSSEESTEDEEASGSIDNPEETDSDSGKMEGEKGTDESKMVVQSSNDPMVEQVITNPSWDVTPTKQTGEHVSAYEKGHIDYEEKLKTIQNAVQLDENNIIYWSVKNNGSADSSVAVVSNNEKTEKYRVYIEWVQNEGWKPVKVEKLKKLEGTY